MIRILVGTEKEKQEVLDASKHIHDSKDIDSDVPMVNTFMHLYTAPHLIYPIDTSSKLLRSKDAYWNDDNLAKVLVTQSLESLSKEELITLVHELDRRFMQLMDKVIFERKHQLVDYNKLNITTTNVV